MDNEKQLEEQLKEFKDLKSSVNVIWRDLDDLRKQDRDVEVRLSNVEIKVDQMIKLIERLPLRTQDKIAEVVAPVMQTSQDLKDAIDSLPEHTKIEVAESKKNEENKKRPWFKRLFWKLNVKSN